MKKRIVAHFDLTPERFENITSTLVNRGIFFTLIVAPFYYKLAREIVSAPIRYGMHDVFQPGVFMELRLATVHGGNDKEWIIEWNEDEQ